MTDEIRDSTDAELTTADLAGTSQKTRRAPNESPIETESHSAGLLADQFQPTEVGRELTALLPLLRWTKKLRHSFRAARRTIFAPDGMLYKLVLWTNRARLSSNPTSWSQEQ